MVHPKIIQKTAAIEDIIYTAYTLAYKMYIISSSTFLCGKPLEVEQCREEFFLVMDFYNK